MAGSRTLIILLSWSGDRETHDHFSALSKLCHWNQRKVWRAISLVSNSTMERDSAGAAQREPFVPISQMSIKCLKWWTNFEIHCNKFILFQDWQVLPHLLPDSLLHIQHHLLACFYTLDQLYTTSLYFRGQKIIVTTKVCFLFTVLHLLFSQL